MAAFTEALRSGLFRPQNILRNILAGLVVGSVALPLAMAFAIASGAKPEQGIYTALVGAAAVSLFGGSRVQIAGPTGAFIVILASITAKYGIVGLQVATLMAGVFLLLLGVLRLGTIITFIPAPVITGFTTGIGVIIWIGEWKDFFGLQVHTSGGFFEKLLALLGALPNFNVPTTILGIVSLAIVLASPKIPIIKKIPGPLIALVFATTLYARLHFSGVATIGTTFGGLPQGLPSFHIPDVKISSLVPLLGPAFTIALLGAIESLLSATVADSMAGTKHNPNQELIGQGLANMLTPIFGGFAATGAIARTATNIKSGGNSPLAGLTHSLILAIILLFLTPYISNVPLCALAAILFVVAFNMSDLKHFIHMLKRAPIADVCILLTTFLLTVFTDLVIAVNVGVALAILQFMRRMASSVETEEDSGKVIMSEHGLRVPQHVLVYSIKGPFFFGAVQNFENALAVAKTESRFLIIRLHQVPFADITGLQALERAIKDFQQRGIQVILCEANNRIERKLIRSGIVDLVGRDYCLKTFSEALMLANEVDADLTAIDGFAFDS